jgi:hypothetical protein
MDKKKIIIPTIVLLSLGVGFISAKVIERIYPKPVNIFEQIANENKNIKIISNQDSAFLIKPLTIEGNLVFAGEEVPLKDNEVKERLDRELQVNAYWHSNTILSMKLSNRHFGEIERILLEEGVPADFKYLPLIESGFRDVVSPAGAAGFWQFLKGTAASYGLEVNGNVDERYHIEKSTRAACKYLKEAKATLGSWTLAAAAYNCGVAGVQQKMDQQKMTNYYDLLLNQETSRYVFRMLAMKIIYTNPKQAGFQIEAEELYQPYQYSTVVVDTSVSDLATFALERGIKYKELKMLNSWLRDTNLYNKTRKPYELKIVSL